MVLKLNCEFDNITSYRDLLQVYQGYQVVTNSSKNYSLCLFSVGNEDQPPLLPHPHSPLLYPGKHGTINL